MAGTTLGQGEKTGTVYAGPPASGTVYTGPSAGGAAAPTTAGRTTPSVGGGAARGARIFFLIAAFTGINFVLMFAGIRFAIGLGATWLAGTSMGSLVVVTLLGAGVFAVLGILAKSGNKAAFLIGILLYAGDLVLLVLNDPAANIISIAIHGLFLFYLVSAFRQLD